MNQHEHIDLTQDSISAHVLRMAPPMAVAFFAMIVFNLADTWFVSRLGVIPLAAMGFTFPIIMLLHSVVLGLGLGVSAVVSRVLGRGDATRAAMLATSGLLLAILINLTLSIVGLLSMEPVLKMLGAGGEALTLTMKYLRIWFLLIPFGALSMVSNNAIRATGDTIRPSIIMVTGAILNAILDPLLIFGWGPVPALGIGGAALATGLTRGATMIGSLYILRRFNLLVPLHMHAGEIWQAWKDILKVAVPATATNLLAPLTNGILTRVIAGYGNHAVAAMAAGQRVEMFARLLPMALGTSLVPIIGQNWGARKLARVRRAYRTTNWYAVSYGFLCLLIAIPTARRIGGLFSTNPQIVSLFTDYLYIILIGTVLDHITIHTGFALNAIEKPLQASLLSALRLIGLVLPLALLGSHFFGIRGVFSGMSAAYLLCGLIALAWFRFVMSRNESVLTPHRAPKPVCYPVTGIPEP